MEAATPPSPPAQPAAPAPAGYPIDFSVQADRERDRLTVFFRFILLIPWAVVAYVYEIVALVLGVAAWVMVVITGKYPDSIYRWNSGILRYFGRVGAFAYLNTDRFPPFGWSENPEYPARVQIGPRAESQSRLKAFFRLILVLPLLFLVHALSGIMAGGAFASWITIVFRGYQPAWLHEAITQVLKWHLRVFGYVLLFTDTFPPTGDDAPALSPAAA
jgi:hypothetical protein